MPSPFSEILAHCCDTLPACLRDQYLGADDPEVEVVLAGKMTSVFRAARRMRAVRRRAD